MISRVADVEILVRIQRDTPRIAELSRPSARQSQHLDQLVVRIKNPDAAVPEFAHVLPALGVDSHVIGVAHLARILTRLTVAPQPFSIRPKYLDSMVA